MRKPLADNSGPGQSRLLTHPASLVRQPTWQRVTLLIVLGYEGIGALLGGGLLAAKPDGRLMDMPVEIMHGVFRNFFIPGLILIGLGILNTIAFTTVILRARMDWLLSSLGLGGLATWFIVEIIILQELHWLHAIWGIPVLVGCLLTIQLIFSRLSVHHPSQDG